MSNTRHHKDNRRKSAPRWFTNMYIRGPNRQETRVKIGVVLKTRKRLEDEDVPLFSAGVNKPNADWEWD